MVRKGGKKSNLKANVPFKPETWDANINITCFSIENKCHSQWALSSKFTTTSPEIRANRFTNGAPENCKGLTIPNKWSIKSSSPLRPISRSSEDLDFYVWLIKSFLHLLYVYKLNELYIWQHISTQDIHLWLIYCGLQREWVQYQQHCKFV